MPHPMRAVGFWPDASPHGPTAAAAVVMCRTPASCNAALAGLKTLNRLDNVLARTEVLAAGADEGLMCDADGRIVGGTMTNVFLVRRGLLMTPALNRCGVRGVMRGMVLEAAERAGIRTLECDIAESELDDAQEVFLSNALIGLRPVRRLRDRTLEFGPVSRSVRAGLRALGVEEAEA
jgi:4-amino-4-deoxychorismate lyase